MKILFVTESFAPMWEFGGVARASYEIATELSNKGNDVTVYTINRNPAYNISDNSTMMNGKLHVHYFGMIRNNTVTNRLGVIPSISSVIFIKKTICKFDIIHIHDYRSLLTVIVTYYARKYHVPYIIQAHGALPKMGKVGLKGIFDKLYGKKMLNDAVKVIALHGSEKKQYIELGVNEDKILVIPNGINLNDYRQLPERGLFRQRYGIDIKEKIILFLGRIDPIKGVDILVDAFAKLSKTTENAILVIAGPLNNQEYINNLNRRISEFGIEKRVIFTGPLFDKYKKEAYTDADVYVLPSRYDSFPVSVFEACACKLPVIITVGCGISDIIADSAGVVVELDSTHLSGAINKLLHDGKLSKKYGEQGMNMVYKNYSFESIVFELEINYRDVLNNY